MKKAAGRGSILGLSRIRTLLRLMGDPQDRLKTIHISGTNGKGSFGAMMSSILKNAGYKTGSFSSPAITGITDSFRINGYEITEQDFADIIGDIAPFCEFMDEKPTEFEILTAAAFEFFARRNCDVTVVECGMGGGLDSTNIIRSPLLSVITNVQTDHSAFLGTTIKEIASHKAGIIKAGCPVFFGGNSEEAYEVVSEAAAKTGSELFLPDYSEYSWSEDSFSLDGFSFTYKGENLHIPLLGTYQAENAVNVLTCTEILRRQGLDIPAKAVRSGLAGVKWHGRFEVLRQDPLVIYDGAHNPDGIRCAADSMRRYFSGRAVLLIGVMKDKEYGLYADMLGELTELAFTVTPDNPRALDSELLAEALNARGMKAEACPDYADGVKKAYRFAEEKGLPLVALGSLYMYRQFTEALEMI